MSAVRRMVREDLVEWEEEKCETQKVRGEREVNWQM